MSASCPLDCSKCPARSRCGGTRNFCGEGRSKADGSCSRCAEHPLLRMDARKAVVKHLGGLGFEWPRPVQHPRLPELPDHLPVLVQAYADPVELPWVALHGARLFGVAGGRLTPKHLRPLREVYRLGPSTHIAVEFYVDDRVLEGLWANRVLVVEQLRQLGVDLVLSPNYSVWVSDMRFAQLVNIRRAHVFYHLLIEAGVDAVPDIGFSFFEPDGRLWADWVNRQSGLHAVSLFCGGKKIHASKRALRETLEDVSLFHRAVRPEIAFILGGVHSAERLAAYRRAAPGRRLVICNGMAYGLAQRRRLLVRGHDAIARSARECFLRNCTENDRRYASILHGQEAA
jgi:hypothetical protein